MIGNFASGSDISKDLTGVAKEVHIAARSKPSETYEKLPGADNLWLHPMVKKMKEKKEKEENGKRRIGRCSNFYTYIGPLIYL